MKRLILLSLVLVFAAMPAVGTSFVMVSDENLVQQADLIVRATIEDLVAAPVAAGHPRTAWRAAVTEVLKGGWSSPELTLSVLGGEAANGMSFEVYGAPSFRSGQPTLLFLARRADGTFEPLHLFLGAFYEVETAAGRLAVRNLRGLEQITLDGQAAKPEPLRDARWFADWIVARAGGVEAQADYIVKPGADGLQAITDEFTLFVNSGKNLRWFNFNNGGGVSWRMLSAGQPGVPGGGFTEFQNGLNAWNNDSSTEIKYTYGGTTGSDGGFCDTCFDNKNTLQPEDPHGDIAGSFSCASGGVLAIGGPWFDPSVTGNAVITGDPEPAVFIKIQGADIVMQNGISCFFTSSPNAKKAAEEVYGHELGHTLGLGHSCGDSKSPSCGSSATFDGALMRATVHDDGRGAALNSDDRAGIFALYGDGAAAPPAAPSNLEAVALSSSRVALLFHDNSNNETGFHIEVRQGAGAFADIGTVGSNVTSVTVTGLSPNSSYQFRVRAENAGVFSGYSNTASATTQPSTGSCIQDGDTLCLSSGRFQVEVFFRTTAGAAFAKAGRASAGTATSGLFYFFAADNWELLLKTVNGCGLNSRHWVFYAATTNVEFIIIVTDRQTGEAAVYHNPLNNPAAPVQDTGAFATCP